MITNIIVFFILPCSIGDARSASFTILYKSCQDEGKFEDYRRDGKNNCSGKRGKYANSLLEVGLLGEIEFGDTDRLDLLINRNISSSGTACCFDGSGSFVAVTLNSPGGDLDEAIRMGTYFHTKSVFTHIASDATCASACALAFMGGASMMGRVADASSERQLDAGGRLIFHQPFADLNRQEKLKLVASPAEVFGEIYRKLSDYAAAVSIPAILITKMLSTEEGDVFEIDNVLWTRTLGIAVGGIRDPRSLSDQAFGERCAAELNWKFGASGDFSADAEEYAYGALDLIPLREQFQQENIGKKATLFWIAKGLLVGFDLICIANLGRSEINIKRSEILP